MTFLRTRKSFKLSSLTGTQTPVSTNDRVNYAQDEATQGTDIGDVSSGTWVLQPGRRYLLKASVTSEYSANTGVLQIQWRDNTASQLFGQSGVKRPHTSTNVVDEGEEAVAVIEPTVVTTVEVRIVNATSVSQILSNFSWATIETVD